MGEKCSTNENLKMRRKYDFGNPNRGSCLDKKKVTKTTACWV